MKSMIPVCGGYGRSQGNNVSVQLWHERAAVRNRPGCFLTACQRVGNEKVDKESALNRMAQQMWWGSRVVKGIRL